MGIARLAWTTWGLGLGAAVLLAACSPASGKNETSIPTLDGGSMSDPVTPKFEDFKLPEGPTATHTGLSRLMPRTSAMLRDTFSYGGWDAESATYFSADSLGADAVKHAPLPAVHARYNSTGYEIEQLPGAKGNYKHTFPQLCDLYIVEAPEALAIGPLFDKMTARLLENGFTRRDDLKSSGKNPLTVQRYMRVDTREETEKGKRGVYEDAYSVYLTTFGTRLAYALETEVRKPILDGNGKPVVIPGMEQAGTRVGGQLIILIEDALSRP